MKKFFLGLLIALVFLVSCTEVNQKIEEHREKIALAKARGPKFKPGCFKIISGDYEGCTFVSAEGAMLFDNAKWELPVNKKIRCFADAFQLGFVPEERVEPIACPDSVLDN